MILEPTLAKYYGYATRSETRHLCAAATPALHCLTGPGYRDPVADAFLLATRKGFLFLGLDQAEVLTQMHACLFGIDVTTTAGRVGGELVPVVPFGVNLLGLLQTILSAALLFLFLLAVRNMFKIK